MVGGVRTRHKPFLVSPRARRKRKKKRREAKWRPLLWVSGPCRAGRKMAEEKYFPPRSRTVDMEEGGGLGSSRAFEQRRTTTCRYVRTDTRYTIGIVTRLL